MLSWHVFAPRVPQLRNPWGSPIEALLAVEIIREFADSGLHIQNIRSSWNHFLTESFSVERISGLVFQNANMDHLQLTSDAWLGAWLTAIGHTRRWQARLETLLEPHGIGVNELLVLRLLREAPEAGLTQVELVRRLSISPALMSGLMEALQARAWICSVRSAQDRRRVLCSLSPLGRTHYEAVLRDLAQLADVVPPQIHVREVAA